jgi:glycosyltransferase involved in cell wall biosynthesis
MTRKKIALVISSLYGGGAEKAVLTLSRTLNRLGHTSHVVSLEDTSHYDTAGEPNIHRLPGNGKNALGLRAYRRQARQLRTLLDTLEEADGRPFDLVVSNLAVASNVVARCSFQNVYYCVHNSVEGLLSQARRRGLLRYLRHRSRWRALHGKHLITVSHGLERETETSERFRPASIRTIYEPIEFDPIRRLAREEVPGIPDGDYLIHVGRAARQKRHDILFAAFKNVPKRYRLVLLAGNTDRLNRNVAAHGLTDRVIMPGFQQNPYPWIARAKLMVLSSDFEGLSIVSVESLVCGTPLVATDCPHGPSEILSGDLSRWLVPVGESAALAAKINEALETRIDVSNPDILKEVDAERVARQYLSLA